MHKVEPKVFLVSRPSIDVDGMAGYLDHIGARDWRTDAQTDGEALVELMARGCYKSFGVGLNPNVTKVREGIADYIANILKVGHGCYDIETSVLTKAGWKFWPDVNYDDELATRRADGVIEYHKPHRLVSYEHNGRMYLVDSQAVNLLVTPDHRMLACITTTKSGRKKEKFELIKAEDLGSCSHAYVKTGIFTGTDRPVSVDEATLIGFAIGDGYVDRNRIQFHLRRSRKVAWLSSLCLRLGFYLKCKGDRFTVNLPVDTPVTNIANNIYTEDREKQIPDCLLMASTDTQNGLFEGLMESDGHRGRTGDSFDTTSDKLAGQFQQLCLHLGIAANICYRKTDRLRSFGSKPLTRLTVLSRALKPEVNKFSGAYGRTSWIENWKGEVFCAEVPNGTLYVRRSGKPVWSGNSVLEHANYSFMFCDVSRVCTHELVRHRVGCAISQESLRYVRLEDLGQWLPECIQEDEWARGLFAKTFRHLEGLQCELAEHFGLDDPGVPFTRKKEVTSAMRRIAPIGLATNIGWSANIRTLRHVIEMRTSLAAEEEIRVVFDQVAKIMQCEAPNAFGDYTRSDDGVWTTPNGKV